MSTKPSVFELARSRKVAQNPSLPNQITPNQQQRNPTPLNQRISNQIPPNQLQGNQTSLNSRPPNSNSQPQTNRGTVSTNMNFPQDQLQYSNVRQLSQQGVRQSRDDIAKSLPPKIVPDVLQNLESDQVQVQNRTNPSPQAAPKMTQALSKPLPLYQRRVPVKPIQPTESNILSPVEAKLKDWASKYQLFCKSASISGKEFFCEYDPDNDLTMTFEYDEKNANFVKPTCNFKSPKPTLIEQRQHSFAKLTRLENRISGFFELAAKSAHLVLTTEAYTRMQEASTFVKDAAEKINQQLTVCLTPIYINSYAGLSHLSSEVCEPMDDIITKMEAAIYPALFKFEEIITAATIAKLQKENDAWAASYTGTVIGAFQKIVSAISTTLNVMTKLASLVRTVFNFLYLNGIAGLKRFVRVASDSLGVILNFMCQVSSGEYSTTLTKRAKLYQQIEAILLATLPNEDSIVSKSAVELTNFAKYLCSPSLVKFLKYIMDSLILLMKSLFQSVTENVNATIEQQDTNAYLQTLEQTAKDLKKFLGSNTLKLTVTLVRKIIYAICIFGFEQMCSLFSYIGSTVCVVKDTKKVRLLIDYFTKTQPSVDPKIAAVSAGGKETPEQTVARLAQEKIKLEEIHDTAQLSDVPNATFVTPKKGQDQASIQELSKVALLITPLLRFVLFFSRTNIIPVNEIEDDLSKYATEEAYRELPVAVKNLQLSKVEDYIRYGYCLAQGNEPVYCKTLVESKARIPGDHSIDDQYTTYIKDQQMKYEKKQTEMKRLSQAEIQKQIMAKVMETDKTFAKTFTKPSSSLERKKKPVDSLK